MLILNYDNGDDTLYLGNADRSSTYGEEVLDGIAVMRNIHTKEITGFAIFDFSERYYNGELVDEPIIICDNETMKGEW